jgi:hypothetical protein
LRDLIDFIIKQFGKAPGFTALAFASLLSASCLCVLGCITGGEYVMALGMILGAHFGGGVAVARRDNPAVNVKG